MHFFGGTHSKFPYRFSCISLYTIFYILEVKIPSKRQNFPETWVLSSLFFPGMMMMMMMQVLKSRQENEQFWMLINDNAGIWTFLNWDGNCTLLYTKKQNKNKNKNKKIENLAACILLLGSFSSLGYITISKNTFCLSAAATIIECCQLMYICQLIYIWYSPNIKYCVHMYVSYIGTDIGAFQM